jgi:potassium/hydrogen antiporter
MITIEILLLVASVLLLLSVVASKTSGRLGVPALLVFLVLGMLAGSEGPGGIEFDDPWLAQSLGVVALVFILFAGGLDTEWRVARRVLWAGIGLSTAGVLLTAVVLGGFLTLVLGFSVLEGLLLGAIVSSTDAAAVFAVLRSRNVGLRGRLEPLLELESGSNDPMAVFLTVGFIHLLVTPAAPIVSLVPMFVLQMTLGAGFGYVIGRAMAFLVNWLHLEYEGLYPVLTLSLVLFTYGASTMAGGNGFLAVYIAGLVMGNTDVLHRRSLMRFHDGVAWLMQIAMFVALGLLVFPSRLVPVIGMGLLMSTFLMFVARPVGVLVTLAPVAMPFREKLMVAWVGLRGAVPIILATFPLLAGLPRAEMFFDLVFFVVLTSVALQGTSIRAVARWLGVDAPVPPPPPFLEPVLGSARGELVELVVPPGGPAAGRRLVDLHFPAGTLVVLVKKPDGVVVPGGATVLEAGDAVVVLAEPEAVEVVRTILDGRPPSG